MIVADPSVTREKALLRSYGWMEEEVLRRRYTDTYTDTQIHKYTGTQ